MYYQNLSQYWQSHRWQAGRIASLERENAALALNALKYQQLKLEHADLTSALEYSQIIDHYRLAKVIPSFSYDHALLIINQGAMDGLTRGMVVLGPKGVIGRIISLTAHTAHVRTLASEDMDIQVANPEKHFLGILHDNHAGQKVLDNVTPNEVLPEGTVLYASGLDQVYPANIPVGEVASTKIDLKTGYAVVGVRLYFDEDKLYWVYVYNVSQPAADEAD